MDYEKKYKEMKARVLEIGRGYVKGVDFSKPRQIAEYICPELGESEDERIRKAIINVFASHKDYENFYGASVEDILAWLEKQNSNADNANKEYWRGYREGKQEVIDKYAELEKQGEQKPTTKVEPKFKVGDYVVVSTTKGDKVVQIASVEYFKNGHPSYITTEGRWFGNGIKAHLLTNKDVETTTIPESQITVSENKFWSKEDEAGLSDTLWAIQQARAIAKDENDMGNLWYAEKWLKSLKDRVGCEADCTTTKEWSEEDEAMFQGVIETEQYMLDVVYGRKIFAVGNEDLKEECTKELAWLKSLRDRIK